MSLLEDVKQICNRLANHGWRDLFLLHGLDITDKDLKTELSKKLSVKREVEGFEDFAMEGMRGIEPGQPARSLLYHAFASPNVRIGGNGLPLTAFPTLAELETVENYVYGIKPPSFEELRKRAGGEEASLAIVVYASEYRPAPETVHRKHADMCFSRTGVARVGTAEPLYHPQYRGFVPDVQEDDFAFRVLPARYSAYLAVRRKGNQEQFGPMRFIVGGRNDGWIDASHEFWVPIHKLFDGEECIAGLNLQVDLQAHHVNEKLHRIHKVLREAGFVTLGEGFDISKPPFILTEGIAEWSTNPEYGSHTLMPIPHAPLIEKAMYEGRPLMFTVPPAGVKGKVRVGTFSSSLLLAKKDKADREAVIRPFPEYVHVRHTVEHKDLNLNKHEDIKQIIRKGGFQAQHYVDFTGDGWVEAVCKELVQADGSLECIPAYSIVTAPDFFPNCDQRELMDWWEGLPEKARMNIWFQPPETLSDERLSANLELKRKGEGVTEQVFEKDRTVTAIVSLLYEKSVQDKIKEAKHFPATTRHSYLTDAASGLYAPGWDVSIDQDQEGDFFLAAYGLGSPFPEDAKLCAALSTFWPAVAPDAARTFEPNWATVSPLTDEEIGQTGNRPWDGVPGPRIISTDAGRITAEYTAMAYADYVQNALDNKFTLALTKEVDVHEYQNRVRAMAHAYIALGITPQEGEEEGKEKAKWAVLSFRKVSELDEELLNAWRGASGNSTNDIGAKPKGIVYRFEMYKNEGRNAIFSHPKGAGDVADLSRIQAVIQDVVTLFVNGQNVVFKHTNADDNGNGKWTPRVIRELGPIHV